jgi:hypothetical protein
MALFSHFNVQTPELQPQELPYDDPDSCHMFLPGAAMPFAATSAALALYSQETIFACLMQLRRLADQKRGLYFLQVFVAADKPEDLLFIEDQQARTITALLPSDY